MGAFVWFAARHADGGIRYTNSDIVSISTSHEAGTAIWIRERRHREIWIGPNGAGRIAEEVETVAAVDAAQQDMLASMSPSSAPERDTSFPAGGLVYLTDTAIDDGLATIAAHGSGGDALRALASLLAETAPDAATIERARLIAVGLSGVTSEREGDLITFGGDTALAGGTRIEITFNARLGTFVRERWLGLVAQPGLALTPPILMFDRLVLASLETSDMSR